MIINGIIAEYNPFHTGHEYHLKKAKADFGGDINIVVMSGDFVQRGEPAILDKFLRTKAALLGGADLVLELPAYSSVSSASDFAFGGVKLLDSLSVVNNLCFGQEANNLSTLLSVAQLLSKEPIEFKQLLKEELSQNKTFPKARQNALMKLIPELKPEDINESNNILAIEYLKSLKLINSSITPCPTLRQGQGYNQEKMEGNFPSALSIRTYYSNTKDANGLVKSLPSYSHRIFCEGICENKLILSQDMDKALKYKLFNEASYGFEKYLDVTRELSDRIVNKLYDYRSFSQFSEVLKSKNITLSHVKRALLHILLDITDEKYDSFRENVTPYAKLLGFRKESKEVLTYLKKKTQIPIISKYSNYKSVLNNKQIWYFEEELRIRRIYQSLLSNEQNSKSELSTPIVII